MKMYRIELINDAGDSYLSMAIGSEEQIKKEHGDTEGAKIIAGEHDKWHLTETYEVPDPPSETT